MLPENRWAVQEEVDEVLRAIVSAVEILMIYQMFDSPQIEIPAKYTMVAFWVVRLLVAVIAGGVAVARNADSPRVALEIGAATPLIVNAIAHSLSFGPPVPK